MSQPIESYGDVRVDLWESVNRRVNIIRGIYCRKRDTFSLLRYCSGENEGRALTSY